MRNQALAINQEFVLLGLAPKDGMIFENQALSARTALALKEEGGGESADSATDDDAIVGLSSVDDILRQRIVTLVADGMSRAQDFQRIPVCLAVFADPAVAAEFIFRGEISAGVVDRSRAAPRPAAWSRENRGE